MTKYNYTDNIPFSTNNPSNDQPKLQENTNSIDNLINEDHYSFNQNNGGFHKQSRYPNLLAIPGATISSSTTLYAKSAEGTSNLFSTNGVSGNEYQLTFQTTSSTQFALFGNDNAITTGIGGWTFMPGNGGNQSLMVPLAATGAIIYQYGSAPTTLNSRTTNIVFPIPFTTVYSVVANLANLIPAPNPAVGWVITDVNTTSFNFRTGVAVNGASFYWMAIGV